MIKPADVERFSMNVRDIVHEERPTSPGSSQELSRESDVRNGS
jgi:hypothetical protein